MLFSRAKGRRRRREHVLLESRIQGDIPRSVGGRCNKAFSMTTEDIKHQLNEYHLLVAEIIGGMSADISELQAKLVAVESQSEQFRGELAQVRQANQVLTREVLRLQTIVAPVGEKRED